MIEYKGNRVPMPNSMLHEHELHFLVQGIKDFLPVARGDIVELGPWLGASSIALHRHLLAMDDHWIFDWFKWDKYYMDARFCGSVKPEHGTDFRLLLEARLSAAGIFDTRIESVDLKQLVWKSNPIRVLFIDAFKRIQIAHHCIPLLFPDVIEGGLILDQDFLYEPIGHSFMHIYMYRLRHYLEPVAVAESMICWRVVTPIPVNRAREAVTWKGSIDEMFAAYQYWMHECSTTKAKKALV